MNSVLTSRLSSVALAALWISPACAQMAPPTVSSDQDDGADDSQGNLIDIIVTAQRREQSLQKVPVAVTAISAGDLAATGATGTEDLNVAVPGLNFAKGVGNGLPYIRGVGTQDNAPGNENAVSVYLDNIYLPAASTSIFEFSDIRRVEVLRGPQGTLFGRNASGGVIHVITRDPSLSLSEMNWSVGYSNYDTKTADGYLSVPISGNLAVNAALTYSDQSDAYGRNVITGEPVGKGRMFGVRSKLRWESGGSQATLGFYYNERSGSFGIAYRPTAPTPGLGYYDTQGDARGYINDGKHTLVYLNAAHDFGAFELRSISAYQDVKASIRVDIDALPLPLILFESQGPQEIFTQEFQLSSKGGGPLQYTAGLYYFHAKASVTPRRVTGIPFGGPNLTLESNGTQKTDSYAAYGQATYDLSDRTSATVGLRYTYDKRSYASNLILPDGTAIGQPAGYDNESSGGKLTWRLALNHEITSDVMVYASYNRGFKSGVFVTTELAALPTQPETLDAYEVGLKSTFLGGDARLNLSGFYYDYKDLQVQIVDPATGSQFLANSSRARIYGLEVEGEVAPTGNLRIFGNFAWTPKAEYRDFFNAPDLANGGFFDASGNRIVRTPKFAGSVGAELTLPTSVGDFVLNGNYYYNSGWIAEVDAANRQDSYDLVNASLTYKIPGDKLFLQLWGKNLAKTRYASDILTIVVPMYAPAEPRTFGVKFGARF